MFIDKHKILKIIAAYFLVLLMPGVCFSQTTIRLLPKKGLFITTENLTWGSGSEINFFTPDKKNHHYFFNWWDQDIDSSKKEKDILFIGSENTAVNGFYTLKRNKAIATSSFDCKWNLKENALADILYAKLWLPFLQETKWGNSKQQFDLNNAGTFLDTVLTLQTPFGFFKFSATHPFKIKRSDHPSPGKKDYDKRSQYLIIYEENILIEQQSGLHRNFIIEALEKKDKIEQHSVYKQTDLKTVSDIWQPDLKPGVLLPEPQFKELKNELYIIPKTKSFTVSAAVQQFRKLLLLNWQIGTAYYPVIETEINKALADEGYQILIDASVIRVQYKTPSGLQYALQTLVQLTQNKNQQLVIPQGIIKDEPSVSWRGIHMFTGPASWQLHRTMYDRVLLPLKMNKTVLQCEQAAWRNFPEIHNAISVPLKDLKEEFNYLRKNNCEPVPLIQSLGHMEWFFKAKKNRFMAVNPQYPYTLNPDLQQSKRVIKKLWDEVFNLLHPKTMHIGFDEIGMIGFNKPREKEIDYWKTQLNLLDKYAKNKKAALMIWGDMGLAPDEGPDACNGLTKERASIIRQTIPAGTLIGDWHYLGNPNPEVYTKNLKIWKSNNNIPIATPWLSPDNVRGFVLAAIQEKAGVLQSTWADFESSEKNMLLNIEQFAAYILAMDYAWSGRKELPKELPYDAVQEWTNRFYAQSKPIGDKNGWRIAAPIQLQNISSAAQMNLPAAYNFKWKPISSSGFAFKATTETILPEGTPVAMIRFLEKDNVVYEKQIRYGVEVRSKTDQRTIYAYTPGKDEKTLFDFFQKKLTINGVQIKNLHAASGLTIDELILIE